MEGYLGEVKYFAGNYLPDGWAFCEGQQLTIVEYTALFAVIGIQFGGDGRNYFNLPDFRGRTALGPGQSIGTSYRHQGEHGGNEAVALTQLSMPTHTHTAGCDTKSPPPKYKNTPKDNLFGIKNPGTMYASGESATAQMKKDTVTTVGQNAPHENMPPWLCMRMIICVNGIYPPRS